jgi:hypothetical protein
MNNPDTTPAAVERLSPYAVDGGCDAYGQMEQDDIGDYVTYEDYAALSAQLTEEIRVSNLRGNHIEFELLPQMADLTAQLETANQRAETAEVEASFFQSEVKLRNRIPSTSSAMADMMKRAETAHAAGKAGGLREAADMLKVEYRISSFWLDGQEVFGADAGTPAACYQTILALIPADTPSEPAQVTVQEAAKVLLGDDFNSPLLEALDAYNNDYDVGQDLLNALRAIAGDES